MWLTGCVSLVGMYRFPIILINSAGGWLARSFWPHCFCAIWCESWRPGNCHCGCLTQCPLFAVEFCTSHEPRRESLTACRLTMPLTSSTTTHPPFKLAGKQQQLAHPPASLAGYLLTTHSLPSNTINCLFNSIHSFSSISFFFLHLHFRCNSYFYAF